MFVLNGTPYTQGDHFGAGLILRTFLQMIDISPGSNTSEISFAALPEISEDCPVKIEETDSYDEIELLNYSDQEIPSRLSELVTDSEDEIFPKLEVGETPRNLRTCKTKKCGCGGGTLIK